MRLIDADEFMKTVLRMKRLNEVCPLSDIYLENEKINNYETGQRETFDLITEHLYAQPTAYDPDKVVEQLEEIRVKKTCNKEKCDTKELCRICVVDDAIEIVKHGCVSDDACEWRLCDEEANVYDTSCRNQHILIEGTPKENNYEYCPYCGKKIKIVGD